VLSRQELGFIVSHLRRIKPGVALDVGIGNGRIIDGLLTATESTRFYGVDIAEEMVAICRERFSDEPRVEQLVVSDLSALDIPIDEQFDFISAIRVITYSEHWRQIVSYLVSRLRPGGVLVFTMPNRNSLNRISRPYAVPWYSATRAELRATLEEAGAQTLEVGGFMRLPHFLYDRQQKPALARLVTGTDAVLGRLLGGELLIRELFVAAIKPHADRHAPPSPR
jgi:ubiquinone/menaquinone biosynthesis C-methylase UbiE